MFELVSIGFNWFEFIGINLNWFWLILIDLNWFWLISIGLNWRELVRIGLTWLELVGQPFAKFYLRILRQQVSSTEFSSTNWICPGPVSPPQNWQGVELIYFDEKIRDEPFSIFTASIILLHLWTSSMHRENENSPPVTIDSRNFFELWLYPAKKLSKWKSETRMFPNYVVDVLNLQN